MAIRDNWGVAGGAIGAIGGAGYGAIRARGKVRDSVDGKVSWTDSDVMKFVFTGGVKGAFAGAAAGWALGTAAQWGAGKMGHGPSVSQATEKVLSRPLPSINLPDGTVGTTRSLAVDIVQTVQSDEVATLSALTRRVGDGRGSAEDLSSLQEIVRNTLGVDGDLPADTLKSVARQLVGVLRGLPTD